MSILRQTTIERLVYPLPSFTSTTAFRVPLYGFGAIALLAVSFENVGLIKAVLGGCFAIMALLWALAVGEPSIPGGVHVGTSPGAISAPLFPSRTLDWEAIDRAVGDRKHLSLTLSSGAVLVLDSRLQRTDHTVLVELINRCAQHRVARERIGDVILGDILLDAAPDGTEPAHTDGAAPAER